MGEYDTFRWYDYVIFTLTLLTPLLIGGYYAMTGGKQTTLKEYLMADRQMWTVPVLLSIYASGTSGMLNQT